MRTNAAIHWRSRALKVVADSSAHAETAEASSAAKSGVYVRTTAEGVDRPVTGPTAMLGDNSASFDLINKEGSSSKSRHFERATVFVKWAVMRLMFTCYLISTKFMIADIFTKAVDEKTMSTMSGVMRNTEEPTVTVPVTYTAAWTFGFLK